ncbi:hypothetical protein CBR_g61509 [Chara braunii]|uniref:F-box domain-containing protein n=1 Tax=Chara braunii TaxID=69332 RepID=A0A388K8W7_CHABU|nr:hypothetical protein CBR_g61509 [Chara braunii]|eukprot:GBG66466.1 hypothetical protein CBR_g61509 [Chara braunii]
MRGGGEGKVVVQHHDRGRKECTSEDGEACSLTCRLTDDTLLIVFSLFSTRQLLMSAALVCRRWCRLARTYVVRAIDPPRYSLHSCPWGSLGAKFVMQLAERHSSTAEVLNLHGLTEISGPQIATLVQMMPKLTDLTVVGCQGLLSTHLDGLVGALPVGLERLDLHLDHLLGSRLCSSMGSVSPSSLLVTDRFADALARRCTALRDLNLENACTLSERGIGILTKCFPELTALSLQSPLLGWSDVQTIFSGCQRLKRFSLVSPHLQLHSGRRPGGRWNAGMPRQALHLARSMPPSLSSLRLYSAPHESIPLEGKMTITLITEKGVQLEELHLQSRFQSTWQTVSVWCPSLRCLDLSHSSRSAHTFTEVDEVVLEGALQLMTRLERLALPTATDDILRAVGKHCPLLVELRFQGHESQSKLLPRLPVTDRGVVAIAEHCPFLRVLSLAGCRNVTASSARALAFHCQMLEVLHLTSVSQMSDEGVELLMKNNWLTVLDVLGCARITKAFVQFLVRQFTKSPERLRLRVLAVSSALKVGAAKEFRDIAAAHPRLDIRVGESGMSWDGFVNARPLLSDCW